MRSYLYDRALTEGSLDDLFFHLGFLQTDANSNNHCRTLRLRLSKPLSLFDDNLAYSLRYCFYNVM